MRHGFRIFASLVRNDEDGVVPSILHSGDAPSPSSFRGRAAEPGIHTSTAPEKTARPVKAAISSPFCARAATSPDAAWIPDLRFARPE
jgi:hypothetical protein